MAQQWYFAHPHTEQSRGEKLRQYLERMSGVTLVNPFGIEVGLDPVTNAHKIVMNDLQMLQKCNGIVAWYPRYTGDEIPIGTTMEICFARHCVGIPAIIYAHDGIAKSPWLAVHGTVFTHISPLIAELKKYG